MLKKKLLLPVKADRGKNPEVAQHTPLEQIPDTGSASVPAQIISVPVSELMRSGRPISNLANIRQFLDPASLQDASRPIGVRRVTDGYEVVTNEHLVELARHVGIERVYCIAILEEQVTAARMREIREIVCNERLPIFDRSDLIVEYVEELISSNAAKHEGAEARKVSISQAARDLCVPGETDEARRKSIERGYKIHGLSPKVRDAATEAGLAHKQSALLAIAKCTTIEDQLRVIEDLKARPRKKRRQPAQQMSDVVAEPTPKPDADCEPNAAGEAMPPEERPLKVVQSPPLVPQHGRTWAYPSSFGAYPASLRRRDALTAAWEKRRLFRARGRDASDDDRNWFVREVLFAGVGRDGTHADKK